MNPVVIDASAGVELAADNSDAATAKTRSKSSFPIPLAVQTHARRSCESDGWTYAASHDASTKLIETEGFSLPGLNARQ